MEIPFFLKIIMGMAGVVTAYEIYAQVRKAMDMRMWNKIKEKYHG